MNQGNKACICCLEFSARNKVDYNFFMFGQCYRKKDAICEKRALKKCMSVRGRKPVLGIFEDLLTD